MKKENATKQVGIRFTPTEWNDIGRFAKEHNIDKPTEWIHALIRQTIYGSETAEPSASRQLTVIDQIASSEEAADLIYQIVADKLGLADLRAELAAFSRRLPASSSEELDTELRLTAARIASIPRDPVDEDEVIVQGEIPVTLTWDRQWTLQEFLALKADERKKAQFYLMTIGGRNREIPYYFWHMHSEFEKYLGKLKEGNLNENEKVSIYGATYVTPITSANLKFDLETRLVNIVRYVARDSNLGKYETLEDKHLRYYMVINTGKIPPGLPCEFTFGWTSDSFNAGKVDYPTKKLAGQAATDKTDTTYRPVVYSRWHYTDEERKGREIRTKVPFDELAVPRHMRRYLAY